MILIQIPTGGNVKLMFMLLIQSVGMDRLRPKEINMLKIIVLMFYILMLISRWLLMVLPITLVLQDFLLAVYIHPVVFPFGILPEIVLLLPGPFMTVTMSMVIGMMQTV